MARNAGVQHGVVPWAGAAAGAFLCNCAVGIRAVRAPLPPRARWVHHALYVATSALTVGALGRATAARHSAAIPLAIAAIPLALLPRLPGRSWAHAAAAAACAPGFGVALGLALRSRRPHHRRITGR